MTIVVAKPKRCLEKNDTLYKTCLVDKEVKQFHSFYSCALLPMAPARVALLKQWRKGDRLSRFWCNDLCNLTLSYGWCLLTLLVSKHQTKLFLLFLLERKRNFMFGNF